ncbi:MAG: type IV pilus modification PilV family protein [Planctomycetota bacterium]|jgi:prepilin-type N-terminal cleavage/methylation domain-containing protein
MKRVSQQIRQTAGFTLLEVMFATVLIGLVISALAASSGAFTVANGYGVDLSTAEFLIEEIREFSAPMTFDVIEDYESYYDISVNPPIDVSGAAMPEFSAFTQVVDIENVSNTNFDQVVADGTSDFLRVTVTITKNGTPISSASWIRAQY